MAGSKLTLAALIAVLASSSLVNAGACQLKNQVATTKPPKGDQFCKPQGAGSYTFTMQVSEVSVPTFSGGVSARASREGAPGSGSDALAGDISNTALIIYDNACKAVGVYDPAQSRDCGIPYTIQENFLPYVLAVTNINKDAAKPSFAFKYANGKYLTNNNHCGCEKVPHALEAEQGCKCAFSLKGEAPKSRIRRGEAVESVIFS